MPQNQLAAFIDDYSQGKIVDALSHIFSSVERSLTDLKPDSTFDRVCLAYADALVFGERDEVVSINKQIQDLIMTNPRLRGDLKYFLHALKVDALFLFTLTPEFDFIDLLNIPLETEQHHTPTHLTAEKYTMLLDSLQTLGIAEDIGINRFKTLKTQGTFFHRCELFKEAHFKLCEMLMMTIPPFIPLSYEPPTKLAKTWNEMLTKRHEGTPVFFMAPYKLDWDLILQNFPDPHAVFVFPNKRFLWHCLNIPAIHNRLILNDDVILCLDIHPHPQLIVQQRALPHSKTITPFFFFPQHLIPCPYPFLEKKLAETLDDCLNEQSIHTCSSAQELYKLGRLLNLQFDLQRLGHEKIFSIDLFHTTLQRIDPEWRFYPIKKRKGQAFHFLDSAFTKSFQNALAEIKPIGQTRKRTLKKTYRIAHVLGHLSDHPLHGQTQMLMHFLPYYDSHQFKVHLFTHEQESPNRAEYPQSQLQMEHSAVEAAETIRIFNNLDVRVTIGDPSGNFLSTAESIAYQLKEQKIDIVLFHQDDALNILIARMCDTPLKILLDPQGWRNYPIFDAVIVEPELHPFFSKIYPPMGVELRTNMRQIDTRAQWLEKPYLRSYFGLPDDARCICTISEYLDLYLSNDMCWAIAQILRRVPNTYFFPIGPLLDTQPYFAFFNEQRVADKVVFLNKEETPGQMLRSMDLCLNTFPNANLYTCYAAMQTGCPVVNMYYPSSLPNGQEAAYLFGTKQCVSSGKKEDYAQMVCTLLENENIYQEWKTYTLERYASRGKEVDTMHRHQEIILDLFGKKKVELPLIPAS